MLPLKDPRDPHLFEISDDADLSTAEQLLKKSKGRPLIALNTKNEISGLLTARKLHATDFSKNNEKKVKDLMISKVLVVSRDGLLKDLCLRMVNENLVGFFISHQGQIEAAIASEDLIKIIHRLLVKAPETSSLNDHFFEATIGQYLGNPTAFESGI